MAFQRQRPLSPAMPKLHRLRCPIVTASWSTTRFVDPTDLRHDMHVNIVTFFAGRGDSLAETHVMEHGLYVLQGHCKLSTE